MAGVDQVIGVCEVDGSQELHSGPKEDKGEQPSRQNSKEESPEPIVEVKHTSSSSSLSPYSSDCEDSTKLVRRRTVKRYHRATTEEPENVNEPKNAKRSTAELTISINTVPGNQYRYQGSQKKQQVDEEEFAKSHYRTRQIGAYYGKAKERQHQAKTSSSSSTSTSSKIAKCSITTNRKSTTSHHQLISESLSSLAPQSAAKASQNSSERQITEPIESASMLRDKNNSRNLSQTDTLPLSSTTIYTSPKQRVIRPMLELRLNNHHFNDDLFDRTNNGFLDNTRSSFQVQQEEESSVHHKQSFSSSTTSMRDGSLRKEAMSSSTASEAASVSRQQSKYGAISSDLSASSSHSRHFKTSASLIVSGNTGGSTTSRQLNSGLTNGNHRHHHDDNNENEVAPQFLNSEVIFSSPDVCSLVKEIGTDFAELENALSSTSGLGQTNVSTNIRGVSSLSTRLFGRRLLSPVSTGPQYPAINNSGGGQNLFDESARQTIASEHGIPIKYTGSYMKSDFLHKDIDGSSLRSRYSGYLTQEDPSRNENEPSNGDKIKELMTKAQSHAKRLQNKATVKADEQQLVGTISDKLEEESARVQESEVGKNQQDEGEKLHQNHCKAVMTESIERIDQRMSDLCKKFNECHDTKEAIDLLKIMIQMIEKAWSVPVCGDDLGFKLCNSLREAGGLDIILGFIHDSDEQTLHSGEDNAQWMRVLLNGPETTSDMPEIDKSTSFKQSENLKVTDEELLIRQQSSIQVKNNNSLNPLRLNLSKLNQTAIESLSQNQLADIQQQQEQQRALATATTGTILTKVSTCTNKDSDSDIITSDLGLDSTSVESLSYVSATQVTPDENLSSQPVLNGLTKQKISMTKDIVSSGNIESLPIKKVENEEEEETTRGSNNQIGAENNIDLEDEAPVETEPTNENLDAEEASLRKEELVFLSARLLSQCLTLNNRNYIVDNGLHSVIKLACNFTTMKSSQSHRLLSRSIIMRHSSTSASRQAAKANKQPINLQTMQQIPDSQLTPAQSKQTSSGKTMDDTQNNDHSDMHAIIGTEILQHLFKHSEDTCSKMISLGGLQAILYGCRSSNIETLRHCASALANLALYGGPDSQQTMIEQKAHVWLFPLAFNEDDNVQYYACLAIVVLAANQEIEADVLKSSTLNLVEPFVTSHEPQKFAESTTSHIHGQSASWLRKLIPLLESKREEARNLACFHFAMEAYIKKEQGQTQVFKEIGAVEPLRKVGSSPIAISSKFACQALRLIGEKEPHKLSQQVPLWTSEDVTEWVNQIGFERFRAAFVESRVDGDLLLQLDEDMLKTDIGIENGIIRRRFLRELSNLKRIADYSSVDKSGLCSMLSTTDHDFIQYVYPMVQLGVTKDNIHLLDSEQLLRECKIANTIHRTKLAFSIKDLQEKLAMAAASNECSSTDGADQKTLDVFVSYRRSTGSQLASLLKVHLQLRGFSVFIDVERLEAGKFDNNLLDSIKTAKNFILVLSPNALDRCIGDHECKDWVHKEIVAALASNCNIIPIIDTFHWPDAELLPEDMRSITYFNGVRWIHDYQDACVDKVERFIRGEINNGGTQWSSSAQSSLQRLPAAGTYSSTPSIVATPSITTFPSGSTSAYSSRALFDSEYHPLSFASQYLQHSQNAPLIRR